MLPINQLLFVVCLLVAFSVSAQTPAPFIPLPTSAAQKQAFQLQTATRYEQDLAHLSGPYKKELSAIYKERHSLLEDRLSKDEVLCNEETQRYLTDLALPIFKNNPALRQEDVRLYFSRSFYANAESLGEGTILFNIGLFHRLQNEAQAAFVICHELAHYFLNHSADNIESYVKTVHSDAFQKELKGIQKSGYRQNSQLEALTKTLTFRSRRHSRSSEQAADSMALELLKNTPYDVAEALTCLQLLDSADRDKYNTPLALEQQFQFAAFPFKTRWLQSDELQFIKTENAKIAEEADSLKTHPDCAKRIAALTARVEQYKKPDAKKFLVSTQLFQNLIQQFDFEIIEHCYQSKQTSRALYFSLQLLPHYPNNAYLAATIGQCLNAFYTAQKAHELGTLTELPNAAFDANYNSLLQLIQNLRLPEISALAYHFLKERENNFNSDERFVNALIQSKLNFGKPEEAEHWKARYQQTFSKPHINQ